MILRRASIGLLALVATGCVTRARHEAAVARMRALEHQRAQRAAELAEVRARNAELEEERSRLEIARASLDNEKLGLLGEIEDLRGEHERIQSALAQREAESGSYRKLVDELEREVEDGKLEIHRLRGRLQVRALDRILFDSASAELKPEGSELLRRVADQLLKLEDHSIRVEGHTDDVPIHTERFPSNWELSVARAAGVVRQLEDAGVPSARLSAQGFGPNQPIASNADPAGRARNRRIEIVLVPEERDAPQ
jgi:chemotaxis protein MotB